MYNDPLSQAAQLLQQRQQQQFGILNQGQQQPIRPLQPQQQSQQPQQHSVPPQSTSSIHLLKNPNLLQQMPQQQQQQAQLLQVQQIPLVQGSQQALPQGLMKSGSPLNQQAAVSGSGMSQLPLSGQSMPLSNANKALNDDKVYQWIVELVYGSASSREQALLELGKKRELYDDLALVLWHSFGVMTSLLEEIIAVYPLLSPPQLGAAASNRVCNALALLQCVASHQETRNAFLNAYIPLYLYPFLSTSSKQRPFEYLRLTSLGVIGALVKNDTPEVIAFLLTTEIIPLCLRIMESSSELSKTVAIFIVQKILVDDAGLSHVCATFERFNAVNSVLKSMVDQLVQQQTVRLLKHVVRCYLRLSDNADARKALRETLPEPLKDATFSMALRDDNATKRCLAQLLVNISEPN